MKKYVIERSVAGVGKNDQAGLSGIAHKSNDALAKLSPRVQWQQSFVTDDKTFCIYLADAEASVHEHARISGFPASKVTEVVTVFDPTTASAY